MIFETEHAKRASLPFLIVAASTFILTGFIGFLASIKVAFPDINEAFFTFEKLRPLHTLFPITGVLSGSFGWITYITFEKDNKIKILLSFASFSLLLFFVTGASLSLIIGKSSGREYFSWPPMFSIPLILSLLIMCYLLFKKFSFLFKKSPEGSWLVGFGIIFILIGLTESLTWLIPTIGNNFIKDLTLQWHGIDTFFAGLNAFLYGVGVFVIQKNPKPLRKKGLYLIAIFSLLFTFGHHHYVSPQPQFLKILAFIASMIAMFSFIKHLRAYKNGVERNKASKSAMEMLFQSVELWTIVSFGSGILFAIPKINLIIHGTYLVVIHAMGSMIGVQLVLVFIAGFSIYRIENRVSESRIKLSIKMLNIFLISLWVLMGIIGLIKGVMKFDSNYYEIANVSKYYLYLLPVFGMILFIIISLISIELIKSSLKATKKIGFDLNVIRNTKNSNQK
jgi:nitric oxide reductase subunit B